MSTNPGKRNPPRPKNNFSLLSQGMKEVEKTKPSNVSAQKKNTPISSENSKSSSKEKEKTDKNKDAELEIEKDPNVPDRSHGDYYCNICDSHMNSIDMWEAHVTGKRHIKNVKKGETESKYEDVDEESSIKYEIRNVKDPIIGLSYIQEIRRREPNVPPIYNCFLCHASLATVPLVIEHVISLKHRMNYIKENSPDEYQLMTSTNLKKGHMEPLVVEAAIRLEEQDGRGDVIVKQEKPKTTPDYTWSGKKSFNLDDDDECKNPNYMKLGNARRPDHDPSVWKAVDIDRHERSSSPRGLDRGQYPRSFDRERSPRDFNRARSPRDFNRERSPRDFNRERSPRDFNRERSPRDFNRERSPRGNFRKRSISPRRDRRDKSPIIFRKSPHYDDHSNDGYKRYSPRRSRSPIRNHSRNENAEYSNRSRYERGDSPQKLTNTGYYSKQIPSTYNDSFLCDSSNSVHPTNPPEKAFPSSSSQPSQEQKADEVAQFISTIFGFPNEIFLKLIIKKLHQIQLNGIDEIFLMAKVASLAQSLVCNRLPADILNIVKQKMEQPSPASNSQSSIPGLDITQPTPTPPQPQLDSSMHPTTKAAEHYKFIADLLNNVKSYNSTTPSQSGASYAAPVNSYGAQQQVSALSPPNLLPTQTSYSSAQQSSMPPPGSYGAKQPSYAYSSMPSYNIAQPASSYSSNQSNTSSIPGLTLTEPSKPETKPFYYQNVADQAPTQNANMYSLSNPHSANIYPPRRY